MNRQLITTRSCATRLAQKATTTTTACESAAHPVPRRRKADGKESQLVSQSKARVDLSDDDAPSRTARSRVRTASECAARSDTAFRSAFLSRILQSRFSQLKIPAEATVRLPNSSTQRPLTDSEGTHSPRDGLRDASVAPIRGCCCNTCLAL